ncbi:MAG: glycoside hydrolase domain-containing protein [Candidatus Acidiferrales bacterium]
MLSLPIFFRRCCAHAPGILAGAILFAVVLFLAARSARGAGDAGRGPYLGFDANDYPGDAALPALRATFTFTGYWLNAPPGAKTNTWTGKRAALLQRGFGFLVLFNGRLDRQLRAPAGPAVLGAADAHVAAASARKDGFAPGSVIFLDQEEGGRMTATQMAYILSWVDTIAAQGFRAGIYCSGMPAREVASVFVITAQDIRSHAGARDISYFIYNDACPPAPGCVAESAPPAPSESGVAFAQIWQYAQSPWRAEFARACRNTYHADGNCYAAGAAAAGVLLDLDSALSADPSNGRH